MNDNILKVSFGGVRSVTANPLWQYDYGQVLVIRGLNLPDLYEVHFGQSKTGNAVTVIGTEDGVDIPDSYLETAGEFYAWIYLHTGDSDGETKYQIKIPVKERAKPTHETPTPVQQSEIERLIALCEEIVEHGGGGGGSDGFSPVVTVTEITGGYQLSIQDKTHTETFNIMNGIDGQDGINGSDGKDGADGKDGKDGINGTDGSDGADGVSPAITITEITGGHAITITDALHPNGQTFNVMDGADGTDASLPTGSSSNDILVWGGGGTWTPTDFSTFVTDNITATTYQFTATGMTDGSTITSADSAVTIWLSLDSGLEHLYMIQAGQQSAISLQPYTLATDQNGVHLGLYTIIDGSLYYTLLTAASANTVLTGTLHVVDLSAKELPTVTSSDNGKILTVANGEWDKGNMPTELPTVTSSDEGKVLRVSSQGAWVAESLPTYNGQVVTNNG